MKKHVLSRFIKFSFSCHKPYYFIILLICLVKAGETIFNAYSLSILISFLEKGDFYPALIAGGIIVGINFLFYFFNKLLTRLREVSSIKMENAINEKIAWKLNNIPFQYLEDPYYLDLKERAKMGINNFGTIYRIVTNGADFIQNVITMIGLVTIIAMFDWKVVIVLAIVIVLSIILILINLRSQVKFFQDLVPINRKFSVYLNTTLDDKKGKDFRNYPLGNLMMKRFDEFEKETINTFDSLLRKTTTTGSILNVINYIQMGAVYTLVALRTILDKLPISTFSLYVSSAISFSQVITSTIHNGIEVVQCMQYASPILELNDIEEEKDTGKMIEFDGKIKTLEFKNVSFSYPKSKTVILDKVSFSINESEKISIVGLNGAGKTTLVKLICRLYKPNEGEILINGININDYEYESYIKQISAVFQDFKLFAYSLKENILNGDGDEYEAYNIACQVGLKSKIDSLENGINTLYSKSYDEEGVELSGGEAQKIAIARALHANSSLIILDEPTSALDPLAEADIYQNFNNLVLNKTALYISHRMSSSVFCDRILVLNGGRVEDFDSHKNLMKKKDSLYFKLFNAQAENYAK